ncbi:hypothetical protein EsDP_00003752 [Epichloe bromicola]|uniref:Uncharacterized protein n=1 Tax=Epichloe bromicola TaxID=79588 RepID=A0ABQ0CQ54_9HYPO
MSSRRRRHSGPPSPHYSRGRDHDDYYYFQRRSGPPPAYTSFDGYPRASLPVDYDEPSRGRRPSRQSAYSDVRGRGYDAGPPPYAYDEPPRARRGPPESRSQGRTYANDRDGPRGRPPPSRQGREPRNSNGNGNGNGKSSSRSKSLSSRSQPQQERRKESTGTPWWQNQIVRTCAATALSTGLSAALDSRHDPGQWKGAKGTKVAVATVGSALVDGFLGQKHPNGVRHKVMKKGVEVAMDEAEKKKHQGGNENKENKAQEGNQQRRGRSRSTGRHGSSHHGDERRHRSHGGGHRRRHRS